MTPEAWWLRAVFYRLDPARFQDSDGDGHGDLQGVVQRLDYIQSLGVDALVLDEASGEPGSLDDLVREASRRQLRVLVRLPSSSDAKTQADVLQRVQGWLSAGVAGVWAPKAESEAAGGDYGALVTALRTLLQRYPGERVLLTDPSPVSLSLAPHQGRRIDPGSFNALRGGVLVRTANFPEATAAVASLRTSLAAAASENGARSNPLLLADPPPRTGSPDALGDAAVLLASRGAVLFNFGEEIGLDLYASPAAAAAEKKDAAAPVMQWTPSNHTPEPKEDPGVEKPAVAPGSVTEFGAYHPYVPPPRGLAGQPASRVHVTVDANVAPALPDPDTLPGFTAGTLPVTPTDGARLNVTSQDRDPRSLLNAIRQMIAEHHGNPTVRNGSAFLLTSTDPNVLLWVRRAPAGSRVAANVLAAVNLSGEPVSLNTDAELESAGMRGGALRPLFASSPAAQTGEATSRLLLPPHGVLLGEIYHVGAVGRAGASAAPPRSRRSNRRGHRVRR